MAKVRLNSLGVRALLNDPGVRADLEARGDRVRAAAAASAPVESGRYRDSIEVWSTTTDRAAVMIGSAVPYAGEVEAATGNLARALDAIVGISQADPDELIWYTTRAGVRRQATRRQVEHWTRGR